MKFKIIYSTPYFVLNYKPSFKYYAKYYGRYVVPAYYPIGLMFLESLNTLPQEFEGYYQRLLKFKEQHSDPNFSFPYKVPPMDHQWRAIRTLSVQWRLALGFDCGCGKTYTIINYLNWRVARGKKDRVIIIAPSVTLLNWMIEFEKFKIDDLPMPYWVKGNRNQKLETIYRFLGDSGYSILLISYETISQQMMGGSKKDYVYNPIFNADYTLMVCDESHFLKNYDSNRTRFITKLSKKAKQRVLMSGTMSTGSPLDLYPQMYILDPAIISLTRQEFFDKYVIYTTLHSHPGPFKPKIVKGFKNLGELNQRLDLFVAKASIDIVYNGKLRYIPYYIELKPRQKKTYSQVLNDLAYMIKYPEEMEILKLRVYDKPTTLILKLHEITSGFIQNFWIKGQEIIREEFDNTKLEALESLIDQNPKQKGIIWYRFQYDKEAIMNLLNDKKVPIYGKDNYTEFERASEGYYVEQISTGVGINLVSANYVIVYSMDPTYTSVYQAIRRTYRKGQKEPVLVYFLIAKNTVDELLYKLVMDKKEIADYLNMDIDGNLSYYELTKLMVQKLKNLWLDKSR